MKIIYKAIFLQLLFLTIFHNLFSQEDRNSQVTLIVSYDFPLWFWGENINTNSESIYNTLSGGKGIMSEALFPLKKVKNVHFLFGGACWFDNHASGYLADSSFYYTNLDGGGLFTGIDMNIEHAFGEIKLGLFVQNTIGYFNFSQAVKITDYYKNTDHWSRVSYSQIGAILKFGGMVKYRKLALRPDWNYKLFGSQKSGSIHGWGISVGLGVDF